LKPTTLSSHSNFSLICILDITPYLVITFFIIASLITLQQTHSLQQVAGPISLEIKPGETRDFRWGLLTDKDEPNVVNLSADGVGAEFLILPKEVNLVPNDIVTVRGNLSIPFDHPGGIKLNPIIRATEVGERVEGATGGIGLINVEMTKNVSIIIGENPFPDFRKLISKPYLQNANIANNQVSVPMESTSNITAFMFNEGQRTIKFNATGYAGTNGTTTIYPAQLLVGPYFLSVDGTAYTNFDTTTNSTTGEKGLKIIYPHDTKHDEFSLSGARVSVQMTNQSNS
jgi:hypothetical protein